VEGEELVLQGHVLRAERVQGRRIGRIRITMGGAAGAGRGRVDGQPGVEP
jgi:hypothetical protein